MKVINSSWIENINGNETNGASPIAVVTDSAKTEEILNKIVEEYKSALVEEVNEAMGDDEEFEPISTDDIAVVKFHDNTIDVFYEGQYCHFSYTLSVHEVQVY